MKGILMVDMMGPPERDEIAETSREESGSAVCRVAECGNGRNHRKRKEHFGFSADGDDPDPGEGFLQHLKGWHPQ